MGAALADIGRSLGGVELEFQRDASAVAPADFT
jgi:hypothetical protein